ncbi:carboxymuconolactone decarboxylase family protein [Amycolatopsis palatopharyngis]|uniref:carboxymuconolactone decarboxylase family protein n=1 Tax=Amycolatopsis palatopharyngis TaxID=187982 RepID=UPI001B85D967|nr:carboxymuconolactone decarboxylase family protein [Amycolatopsis palatopharyngis]
MLIDKQTPEVFRSYLDTVKAVGKAAADAGVDRRTIELVNLRVSQINGCAYCLDVHLAAALKHGEVQRRLAVLPAWRDTDLFESHERAALSLAEIVTTLPSADRLEQEYRLARDHLSDAALSALTWVAITINAFNRVSILSGHRVHP